MQAPPREKRRNSAHVENAEERDCKKGNGLTVAALSAITQKSPSRDRKVQETKARALHCSTLRIAASSVQ